VLRLVYNFITRQMKDFSYLIVANFREQKMGCCALTNQSSHGYSLGTKLSNTSYKGQWNVTYSWIQYGVDCVCFWENSNVVVSMVVPLISLMKDEVSDLNLASYVELRFCFYLRNLDTRRLSNLCHGRFPFQQLTQIWPFFVPLILLFQTFVCNNFSMVNKFGLWHRIVFDSGKDTQM